ncbi:MAG: RrF2 family transcriptional regulator [Egibacteraceae bacterium]
MRLTAKAEYALRAGAELAAAAGHPLKGDQVAATQGIPAKFLERILNDLRRAGIVRSRRGADGGYWLARDADQVTLADVIRAVEGPLAEIRGDRPEHVSYSGAAAALTDVWIALRANERKVLESITLADVASGDLPAAIVELTSDPDAWKSGNQRPSGAA